MNVKKKFVRGAAAAVLAAGLTACATVPPPPPDAVYVETAPPALRSEAVIASPGVGYVWVPGSWNWGGSTYVWGGGTWQRPPHDKAHWTAPSWHRTSRGWYRVDGNWR